MAQNLSNYDAVLKEFYEGAIRETLNNDVPLFRILDEGDREWAGRRVLWPVHTARNSGVGNRAEAATLPTAGNQTNNQSQVTATYSYGRIELTGQVIAAGKNAFAQAMAHEMQGVTNDLKVDLGRQTWGDGTGRLAQVSTNGASSSSVLVANRFASPGQPGARYISAGQLLDAGTTASPQADFSSQTVISVSVSQNPSTTSDTVTFSNSALTVSASDTFLFVAGAGAIEMQGIRGLVDDFTESNIWGSNAYAGSSIQSINRASVTQWNALVLGNSQVARILDGNLMQTALDRIHTESGLEANQIMGHHDVVRAFLDHVSADRRYNSPDFSAGMSALSYNGIPLERDRLAPFNELLVFKKEEIKMYTLLDTEFADDDGAILSRVANQDSFEAYLRRYGNIALDGTPKATLMIRDIQTDF